MTETHERRMVIGTRGSKLALWQAHHVASCMEKAVPGTAPEVRVIHTTGDKITDVALSKIGDKGLFTKELERALAAGEVDFCVHSMKDVPTVLPEGLDLAAMLERADVRDVLVAAPGTTFDSLPAGARVGTGALRRRAQLESLRDDLAYVEVRGNLDTRIKRAMDEGGDLDAIVLASAGIVRMGWEENIAEYFEPERMVPAVGQGAIGVEIRADDEEAQRICALIGDRHTSFCVEAERHIMRVLEGGCQVPIGAYARFSGTSLVIDALVSSLDGRTVVHSHREASGFGHRGRASAAQDATRQEASEASASKSAGRNVELAQTVVDDLIAQGAVAILDEVRAANDAAGICGIDAGDAR